MAYLSRRRSPNVVKVLTSLLKGRPPELVLILARVYYPERTFECSEDPTKGKAISESGVESLYQAATRFCQALREWDRTPSDEEISELSSKHFSDRPYILNVIEGLCYDTSMRIYGLQSLNSRIMALTRDDPAMIRDLSEWVHTQSGELKVSESLDGAYKDLLFRVAYQRRLQYMINRLRSVEIANERTNEPVPR